jgi:hypothetical protein
MIAIQSIHDNPPNSFVDKNFSQDGRFGWCLAMWHPEKNIQLEELAAELRLAVRNSEVNTISRMEVEKWLKSFIGELHWKIHAFLRKSDLEEKGISIFFGILFDHELFFVQTGRIFCAISDNRKLNVIGTDYRHHQMQTLEKLNLLGLLDRDISVKVNRVFIGEHKRFIVLSGNLCQKVLETLSDVSSLTHYVESFINSENPLWIIIEGRSRMLAPHRRKLSRLQISTAIILFLTLVATVYVLFGNRFLDQMLHRTRLSVKRNTALRLDQIPNSIAIDTQDLLKYLERIVNLPARNIELGILWSATLPYQVTSAPVFSGDTIYLAAETNLIAFQKKNRELKWKKSFQQRISSLFVNDNTLVACLKGDSAFGFKEDGTQIWQMDISSPITDLGLLQPTRIGPEDDPRLDKSIMVIPSTNNITILDAHRGENLSTITFKDVLYSLSAYDSYENCFYAIVDDGLICIGLKIAN